MAKPALASDAVTPLVERPPASLRALPPSEPGSGGAAEATADRRLEGPSARPRLDLPPYDLPAALALEHELGLSHVLAQALVRRGLSEPAAVQDFLEARTGHSPSAFAGIERALGLIVPHIEARTKITVHGDYDVDGVCATVILVRSLRALGAEVDWFIPGRLEDGYGVSGDAIRRLATRGTRLLITVDCGITAIDEVGLARAQGIDVVVTDHHSPREDGRLPDCPIVHPAVCGYPCSDLCGSGVAYKLAEALGAPAIEDELELVALATVADLMPLRGENRALVRSGLAALAGTARPGLRALMEVARVDPSALDSRALGFRLAPRINAAGRLRRADAGVELLLTPDVARAREIAEELDAVNAERQAVEQRITWEVQAIVDGLGERAAYVLAGEQWHPGVIGIVASRVVERCHRPVVVIALDGTTGTGSGRSIPGFDLLGALHACSDHLERYGGHRAAAGLTIRRSEVERFEVAFADHARSVLTPELLTPVETVDAVVSGSELGLGLAEELERLEPTGIGNPGLRLLVPGGRFRDPRPMGESGRHARFVLSAGGTRTPAVAFGCDGRLPVSAEEPADATFRLERNHWKGAVEPRLVLRHAWGCSPAPITVLGEPADYLSGVLAELERAVRSEGEGSTTGSDPGDARLAERAARTVIDRRGESPLAVLADALAASAGSHVLAVCADVPRRLAGLSPRAGGFSLACYHTLECEPDLVQGFSHVVALDPPAGEENAAIIRSGSGFTDLAWGEAELRFAQQMHELEYGLRTSLVALYRGLRQRGHAAGEDLEHLLRGKSRPGRPPRLAARLIRVLSELGLVSLEPHAPALSIVGDRPTALDRSAAFRVYAQRHEDGRRFLTATPLPIA